MIKKLGIVFVLLVVVCGFPLYGVAETTLVGQGTSWGYTAVPDLWPGWSGVGYGSFDWTSATWTAGQAAFGNGGGLSHNTYWSANTDLALTKTINIPGLVTGSVVLNVASDNGFVIFINGNQVAKQNAEGYTSYWEYDLLVDPSVFVNGNNEIRVLAEDHGGSTFFDMKLTADNVQPVPLPAAVMLLVPGLAGILALRKRLIQ